MIDTIWPLAGLITAIHTFMTRLGTRKAKKKIYVFSDMESQLRKSDYEQIDDLLAQLIDNNIELTMMGLDFTPPSVAKVEVKSEGASDIGGGSGGKSIIKSENEKMMMGILERVNGKFMDVREYVDSLQYYATSKALATMMPFYLCNSSLLHPSSFPRLAMLICRDQIHCL